ncbi:type III secretion system chaperone [Thalassoglobus sp. JC818]|uniref:type III secretion system chaperone n=1 Tax=Thalassoglobus sp. JC818 TaxID=3232136 RepID=UPI00345B489F
MTEIEQINCLLKEVADICEVQQLLRLRTDQWGFVFSENLQTVIGFDSMRKCLTLSCEIGVPADERKLDTYEQLLVYASLDTQTGGVRVALDAPDGSLLLLLDMFVEDLDTTTFAEVLEHFIDKVNLWRQSIAKGQTMPGESSPKPASQLQIDNNNLFV